MASYSAQYDEISAKAPLDARRRLPKPSMQAQAREPGAKLVPLSSMWALPKLNNWISREPWSLTDVGVRIRAPFSALEALGEQPRGNRFGWTALAAQWRLHRSF